MPQAIDAAKSSGVRAGQRQITKIPGVLEQIRQLLTHSADAFLALLTGSNVKAVRGNAELTVSAPVMTFS